MKRRTILVACCTAGLLAAGCATPLPEGRTTVVTAPPNCAQLAASRSLAEEERRAALEEQANAWKAIVPLVAAAKLVQGTTDLNAAEARIAALDARARRLGCAGLAG